MPCATCGRLNVISNWTRNAASSGLLQNPLGRDSAVDKGMDGVWYEQRVKHGSQVEILALSLRSFGLESLPMIAARSVSYNYGLLWLECLEAPWVPIYLQARLLAIRRSQEEAMQESNDCSLPLNSMRSCGLHPWLICVSSGWKMLP